MRNTIWFSLLKVSPPFFRSFIYDESLYWSPENLGESIVNFVNSYAVLDYLPNLTTYDSSAPSALFLTNELIHDAIFLQYPDYAPAAKISNIGNKKYSYSKDYHANNAFFLKFGEYLEVLKENGVYDNTRIIIAADHGSSVDAGIDGEAPFLGDRIERWNPLLLVKDFNSRGPLTIDMTFMTNADIPVIASEKILSKPVNPFTGKLLTMEPKKNGVTITNNRGFMPYNHSKNTFNITSDQWFRVHDTIFDPSNWSQIKN